MRRAQRLKEVWPARNGAWGWAWLWLFAPRGLRAENGQRGTAEGKQDN